MCRNVLHAAAACECCYRIQHTDRPYAQRVQQLTAAGTTPCCCCRAQLSTGAYQADVLLQLLQHAVCCAMLLCAQQSDNPSSSGSCCRNRPLLQLLRGVAATAAVAAAPPAAAAATAAAAYAPRRSFFMRVALGSRRPPLGSCDRHTTARPTTHTVCETYSGRTLVCFWVPCLWCVLGASWRRVEQAQQTQHNTRPAPPVTPGPAWALAVAASAGASCGRASAVACCGTCQGAMVCFFVLCTFSALTLPQT